MTSSKVMPCKIEGNAISDPMQLSAFDEAEKKSKTKLSVMIGSDTADKIRTQMNGATNNLSDRAQGVLGLAKNLRTDMRQRSFQFMRPDYHPVYGLHDWTEARWATALAKRDLHANTLLIAMLGYELGDEDDAHIKAAREIAKRLKDKLLDREWEAVIQFQNRVLDGGRDYSDKTTYYIENSLRNTYLFKRDFPLGVADNLLSNPKAKWAFAIENSGLAETRHKDNSVITCMIYSMMVGITTLGCAFLFYYMMGKPDLWDMWKGTVQDLGDPTYSIKLNVRTKERGTVASILSALTFSLAINATLDAFGKIDPSTSTVFIGMLLGGTWGFVLDNMLGSDEGFREYRWSPWEGMKYGVGSLATSRYGRYLITIIFDMFFTVILFKLLYTRLVRVAGFSTYGREWIANGMCSFVISFLTYQVYANMTRFEWAYPSGSEDIKNQWISGQSMIMFVIIMNMVYLVTETRSKVGEQGINDPPVKMLVTMCTFSGLVMLQWYGVVDPSVLLADNGVATDMNGNPVGWNNTHLPLGGVCSTQALVGRGFLVLFLVITGCLAFVIFVTSQQTLTGLMDVFSCCCSCCRPKKQPPIESDRFRGKMVLFVIYTIVCFLIVAFFAFVPLYSQDGTRDTPWAEACRNGNKTVLAQQWSIVA